MLEGMQLKNFKSWKDTGEIRFAPLTGFFGTNSSGKSSLLQALLLLKQTTESSDRNLVLRTSGERDGLVDLGTAPEIIHKGGQLLEMGLRWKLPEPLHIATAEGSAPVTEISFATSVRANGGGIFVEHLRYEADTFSASLTRQKDDTYKIAVSIAGKNAQRPRSRPPIGLEPVKCYGFSPNALRYYQNTDFLDDVVLAFERLFQRIYYLGPLRDYPQRVYNWAGERPTDVGKKGELAVAALLAGGKTRVYGGRGTSKYTVEERVAYWLKEMGMVDSFRAVPIRAGGIQYEVRIRRDSESAEVLITDMGFGVSQVLPILTLCYYAPRGSMLILEQPEIHLHPSVQSALADVFVDVIRKRDLQLIIESHSEHLLRRIQRRIAEEGIQKSQAALYFCEMDKGASMLRPLEIDEASGNILNWPKDFFGNLLGDLLQMAEVAVTRQTKKL